MVVWCNILVRLFVVPATVMIRDRTDGNKRAGSGFNTMRCIEQDELVAHVVSDRFGTNIDLLHAIQNPIYRHNG